MFGQQHAVAEHIAAHVADAHGREVFVLGIQAELPEMALDGFPGALGGDAHLLVVITVRAAGSECVAEPESVLGGDRVGDIRERGRALVSSNDQIGVVIVVANDITGRHQILALEIVGDVEHAVDEASVAVHDLGHHRVAVTAFGQLLGHETALGTDRHDHRVLDVLGAHQAQDLRAEVLAPVRPAQAAARHLPAAQVDPLDPRRVDPDLAVGSRLRQVGYSRRVELDAEVIVVFAARVALEGVGAQDGADQVAEAAQDAVLVGGAHRIECAQDGLAQMELRVLRGLGLARLANLVEVLA